MSINKIVEKFPKNFQTSNPNVAVSFSQTMCVCNAKDNKEEIGNSKPVLVAIFSDPKIVTVDDEDFTNTIFVGYSVYQSPSQADEASLSSYFNDVAEEEENGIVSTSLGSCLMIIDSVPVCLDGIPFLCEGMYHGGLLKFYLAMVNKMGFFRFIA